VRERLHDAVGTPPGIEALLEDGRETLVVAVLERAVREGKKTMPNAYCLDLGFVDKAESWDVSSGTILIEANEGYALGSYGLASLVYARFLEARWEELTR